MGVPKFYRWISERYPCLSEVVKEFQLPEFDNLYLDMNGIIHVCSHPEDDNPHFRITEEKIFKDVCHYIDFLFRMIKPRKVFFMAVDGVAPRAKMNQQRGRRFRSAREAELLIQKAQEKGEVLPTEKRFDSNCITPGTPFMVRLQEHLKYFVVEKITGDPLWQGPKVYLSGHETPGEGEHKIMDFIRYSKSQADHDPETRHCLYGLDADLIMLGLTSHEPNFSLLREEVRFGGSRDKNKRPTTPEETTFHLLHLSLMRDYLSYEFSDLKTKLSFPWNLENIIDDWILMGFLVGNDFIPHLPHLHIHADALPLLWKTYMKVLPELDGYLNEGGHLILPRFEKYMIELSKYDEETFESAFSDLRYLESKLGGKSINESADVSRQKQKLKPLKPFKVKRGNNSFVALEDESANNVILDEDEDDNDEDDDDNFDEVDYDDDDDIEEDDFNTFEDEFQLHKRDYYMNKMSYTEVTFGVLQDQAQGYVIALQWILLYYFEGCPSWSWYYPHHYAPYISDVRGFSNLQIRFELSKPFLPFQQLMAVLPAASKDLLPIAYQSLMTEESSAIIDFYPVNFETDLNGKQQDWEAVVLIPFIDEERLLDAMASKESLLTKEEKERNKHGPHIMCVYTSENQGFYPSSLPGVFPDLHVSRAKIAELSKDLFNVDSSLLRKGLLDTFNPDKYFPGFPRLHFLAHSHELAKCGCKVFQHNSRGENMLLKIQASPSQKLEDVADELLGNITFVGWPHLHEARVVAVANESYIIDLIEDSIQKSKKGAVSFQRKKLTGAESSVIAREAGDIKERHKDRFAIEVGNTEIVVYACPLTGKMYTFGAQGSVILEKQFASNKAPYLFQMTVKDLDVAEGDDGCFKNMEELFPIGCDIFMLGNPHYGAQGKVKEILPDQGNRLRIVLDVKQEPDFTNIGFQSMTEEYLSNYQAGQQIGIDGHTMSRITGSVFIERSGPKGGKANIGLNLKFTKKCEEVPGYTKKFEEGWKYSYKCIKTVEEYISRFPEVWTNIQKQRSDSDIFTEDILFPKTCETKLTDVLKFLEDLPCTKAPRMKFGCEVLAEDSVKEIEEMTAALNPIPDIVKMKVKPRVVFRPLVNQGSLVPDPDADFQLYDRIVVVKLGYSVPFGKRGTIIGIPNDDEGLTPHSLYDVVFDEPFPGGIALRCSPNKGYRVPGSAMLNLTFGEFRKNVGIDKRLMSSRIGGRLQLAGDKTFTASGSGTAHSSFNNNGSRLNDGGVNKAALWKQNQQNAATWNQRAQFMQQPVKWDKGQPQFGQISSYQKQGGLTTAGSPKVQSPHRQNTPAKDIIQNNPVGSIENMEFDSLWKNLQLHKNSTQEKTTTEPKLKQSSNLSPQPHKQSPQPVKQSADHVTIRTSMSQGTHGTTSTSQGSHGMTSVSQGSHGMTSVSQGSHSTTSTSQGSHSMTSVSQGSHSTTSTSQGSNDSTKTQISLQSLFSKTSMTRNNQQEVENNEFLAMFNSLKVQADDQKMLTSSQESVTEPNNKSKADAALKQLLKIGLNPKQESSSVPEVTQTKAATSAGNAYGRQVSLQELFEEADRQQKQKSQQGHSPSNNVKENRDPMAELELFCKTLHNPGVPQFDFKNQPKQNAYIANVLLPNGQRYEGSLCKTKAEAAKSAASMALLCLNSKPNHPPIAQIPNLSHFVSPNSAFSPINLSGNTTGFLHRPPQLTSQMLLTPQHFINQPPPSLSFHQLLHQQQVPFQSAHITQNFPPEPFRPPPVKLPSPVILTGLPTQPCVQTPPTQLATKDSVVPEQHITTSASGSSSTTQKFIPLQVARNQKHPIRRKESESENVPEAKKETVSDFSSSVDPVKLTGEECIEPGINILKPGNPAMENQETENKVDKRDPGPDLPASQAASKTQAVNLSSISKAEEVKKKKSRLAANFNKKVN